MRAGWNAIAALALSTGRTRAAYLRSKAPIDRVAVTIMELLGFRLLAKALLLLERYPVRVIGASREGSVEHHIIAESDYGSRLSGDVSRKGGRR